MDPPPRGSMPAQDPSGSPRRGGEWGTWPVDINVEEKRLEYPQMSDARNVRGRERRGRTERGGGDEQLRGGESGVQDRGRDVGGMCSILNSQWDPRRQAGLRTLISTTLKHLGVVFTNTLFRRVKHPRLKK